MTDLKVRAIIWDASEEKNLIVIRRKFDNREFYMFPGGGIKEGESPTDALIRECKDGLNADIKIINRAFEYTHANGNKEHFYGALLKNVESLEINKKKKDSNNMYEKIPVNGESIPEKIAFKSHLRFLIKPHEVAEKISSIKERNGKILELPHTVEIYDESLIGLKGEIKGSILKEGEELKF